MDFNNIEEIKRNGFEGFKLIKELLLDNSKVPEMKGVYLVLNIDKTPPSFLKVGTGGHFKGKDPNISFAELKSNWVDETLVVYIGKAGSENGSRTLKSRLNEYFRFGKGNNVGHYGGRLIWQLASSNDLIVCWKRLPTENPRTVEAQLIKDFVRQFGKRPFANLSN